MARNKNRIRFSFDNHTYDSGCVHVYLEVTTDDWKTCYIAQCGFTLEVGYAIPEYTGPVDYNRLHWLISYPLIEEFAKYQILGFAVDEPKGWDER